MDEYRRNRSNADLATGNILVCRKGVIFDGSFMLDTNICIFTEKNKTRQCQERLTFERENASVLRHRMEDTAEKKPDACSNSASI